MQQALDLACGALDAGELPIAATITLDGEVIASATTSERADRRFLVHAELKALLAFDQLGLSVPQRRRAVLHTTLEPCLMCMGAVMSAFLGEVRYALPSPGDGAVGLLDSWARAEEDLPGYTLPRIVGGEGAEASRALFAAYVEKHAARGGAMWRWAKTLADLPIGPDGKIVPAGG